MGQNSDTAEDRTTGDVIGASRAFIGAFADYAGWRGVVAILLVGGGALIEGFSILLIVPILGLVFGSGALPVAVPGMAWIMALAPVVRLALLLGVFVAAMVLRGVVLYARDLQLMQLQTGFVETLRNRVMRTLAAAPWAQVSGLNHASVVNVMGSEIGRIAATAHYGVQTLVAFALLGIQLALAFILSPIMAGIAAALMAIGAAVTLLRQRRVRGMGADLLRSSQAMMGSTAAFLGGLKAAAAEGGAERFVREFEAVHADLRATQVSFVRLQARARIGFAVVSALAAAAVVLGGVLLKVAPGVLITLIIIFSRMSGPALLIQQSVQNIVFGLASFEAVQTLLASFAPSREDGATPVDPPPGPIVLDRATHVHAGGGGIRQASLSIAPGTFLGIAGPSGAGKTSLVDLIAGLIAPREGTVSVGGVVLDPATRSGWRRSIGYVPQDGFLFHDSIRRNLDWSAGIDDARIAWALAVTGADRVVAGLEDGLDTVVGERGSRLSGGERQRLAIARALLRDPRLLILDEATNAIDIAGEADLLTHLAALSPRPTIVMVAHRGESLAHCDRVITVRDGRMVD